MCGDLDNGVNSCTSMNFVLMLKLYYKNVHLNDP